jgi:hypothetical protein
MHFYNGAFLMNGAFNQRAQLSGSSSNYDCTSATSPNYNADYCNANTPGTLDTTPDITVNVETTASTLANTVPVNILIPLATRIVLYARIEDSGETVIIGDAQKLDDLHWRLYWDTRQFHDGSYRLRAVITNAYGTYDQSINTAYTIQNSPITSSSGTSGNGGATSTTSGSTTGNTNSTTTAATTEKKATSTEVSKPTITLSIDERAPLVGNAVLKVSVQSATRVTLFARQKENATFTRIGDAVSASDGAWRFEWDTSTQKDGEYALKASVTTQAGTFESTQIFTSLKNVKTETASSTQNTVTPQTTLEPDISVRIPEGTLVTDDTDVVVLVSGARYVEEYALPKKSLTPLFLGLAQKKSDTEWRYRWYTKQTPNGEFAVFARVGHMYGVTESSRTVLQVKNEITPTYTPEQKTHIEEVTDVVSQLEKITEREPMQEGTTTTTTVPMLTIAPKETYVKPIELIVAEMSNQDAPEESLTSALTQFRQSLDTELAAYARALRSDDAEAAAASLQKIEVLKKEFLDSFATKNSESSDVEKVNTYLAETVTTLSELTARNESVIKERIGDRAFVDSDKDGIADYDELNLYQTNPFSADTDNDGFIDGAEIIQGYDPHDARAETLVAYESPRENGTVRDDVLTVESITTLTATDGDVRNDGIAPSALIAGRGLPNSYVSLFVFSTPVVITVKTDNEGAWSYIFDKELENGAHEIYVGVTDNGGHIVAKSNPLAFVKTAEAFTPVDAEAAVRHMTTEETVAPTLMTDRTLLALASIAIVGLGLVLMLIGFHVRRRDAPQILRFP